MAITLDGTTGITTPGLTNSGSQTVSAGTANGVTYLNGSKVLTSGSALTFDGTNLGVGNASSRTLLDILSGTANTTGDVLGQAIITGPDVAPAGTGGSGNLVIQTNSNQAANVGGSIAFGGRATDSSTVGRGYAVIKGAKENSTSANRDGYFAIFTRTEASGQTEKLRVDSVGNLGLGVTPSAWRSGDVALDIGSIASLVSAQSSNTRLYNNTFVASGGTNTYKTSSFASYYDQGSGVHRWFTAPSGTAGNAITFIQAMTLDSGGNLLVGTTSSGWTASNRNIIHVAGTSSSLIGIGSNSSTGTYLYTDNTDAILSNNATGSLRLNTSGTERARIDSSGNLLVGTTSTSAGNTFGTGVLARSTSKPLAAVCDASSGSASVGIGRTNSTGNYVEFYYGTALTSSTGTISTNGSTTSYNTSSDYRLKNITGALTGYKERLMSLLPKQGTWIVDGSEFRGFLAHEFANPYRASVTGEKDAVDADGKPVMQGMQASSSEVMADLVAMIQEQQAIIQQLQADVAALKGN